MAQTLASPGRLPAPLLNNAGATPLASSSSSLSFSGRASSSSSVAHEAENFEAQSAQESQDDLAASLYSCSFSSTTTTSSSQQFASTAPSPPIIIPVTRQEEEQEDSTMGRPSVSMSNNNTASVSFSNDTDSSNALPWSKSHCSWSAAPSPTTPTSSIPLNNGLLLKELLHDAMSTTSTPSSTGLPGISVPLHPHPRMGRRMGLAGGSAVALPVMPSSSPMMASSAAASMTPLMSRTGSEASTSSTSTNSSVNTTGSADAFRFDDDEDEDLEEVDTEYESEVEEDDYYPASSSAVAGSSSSGSVRGSGHSSCPSNSSLDSFTLPRDCFPSSHSSAASLASFSIASSSSSSSSASSQASSSKATRIETPYTFPCPTPISELRPNDLEASLRFSSSSNGAILPSSSSDEESAPPAFFPLQRVSFAPQLKIKTQGGVPLAMSGSGKDAQQHGISGMMLGVTGTVQILDAEKSRKAGRDVIKSQRMIADFATDLTNGLKIWRRDASPIVQEKIKVERQWRRKYNLNEEDLDDQRWDEMLAPGTFMLPLSMKIPCSDKLPPSFESAHFRIRYVMSLAIFGSHKGPDGKPEVLHVHSIPFTILPSTLPTPAPQIPMLTHDSRKTSFFSGITRALSLGGGPQAPSTKLSDKSCTHIICPSLPTSSFSPGSVIPITLRIADCPTEPTDLYIRLSLIRKVYVRDAAYPMMNEWGLPEDVFFEEFCKEEEEIVSRWGYVPYSVRAQEGATPGSKAQVIISDITLPVGGANGEWNHGYSCALDLAPTVSPSMKHGECSWFSPALSRRPPARQEYERYVHASTRHFVSIEIGFANDRLGDALNQVGNVVQDMEIPQPNTFTYPASPSTSTSTGLPATNPFPSIKVRRAASASASCPSFPGKMKEILIPVTIGSVAEPQMSCLLNRNTDAQPSVIPSPPPRNAQPQRAATAEESADRAARDADESDLERYERVGDDGEEPWMFPPPSYAAAVTTAPAYS